MVNLHKLAIRFRVLFQIILIIPEWLPLSKKAIPERD